MSTEYLGSVLRLLGLINGPATEFDGEYLVAYDPTMPGVSPNGVPMSAHVRTCPDLTGARVFGDPAQAVTLWRAQSGRIRPDGRPDRPLTAFTVELCALHMDLEGHWSVGETLTMVP